MLTPVRATRPMRAARVVVVASAVLAPLAHMALLGTQTPLPWLSAAGLAAGLAGRAVAPTWILGTLLAVAPVWQALVGWTSSSSDINLVMPWLAAVAACLAPSGTQWRTGGAWTAPVAMWALVVSVTWPVAALRELDFTTYAIAAATANGSLSSPPRESAMLLILAAEAQLVALLLFDWMWGADDRQRRRLWRCLAPAIGAACLLALWQKAVDPAVASREPWIGLARAAGPLYDGNAMGALAALFGPALAGGVALGSSANPMLCAASWLVLSLGAIVASGSRTALAGWSAAGGVLLTQAWRGQRRIAAAVAVGAFIVAGIGLSRSPGTNGQANAVTRLVTTARTAFADGGAGLVRVAWDRDGYGPASMAMIADHPWIGVGPGAFGVVIADYARLSIGKVLTPDNAQNWWRHQMAELGIAGAGAGFVCSSLAALAGVRLLRRRQDAGALQRAAPILTLGLMSVVSPPTQHPVIQALVGMLLAHSVAPVDTTDKAPSNAPAWLGTATGWAVWAVAATCAVGLAVDGWTTFRPPSRAARFHFAYAYGISAPVTTPIGDGVWVARKAVAVLPPAGRTSVVRIALPHDDLSSAPVRVTVSDGRGLACDRDVHDRGPFECRFPVPNGPWPMVRVEVSRAWAHVGTTEQAALVSWRFEP